MRLSLPSLLCALSLGFSSWAETAVLAQEGPLTARRRIDHSNGIWTGVFRSDDAERRDSFLLDKASFSRDRQIEGRSEQQRADWTLGLGENAAHFATSSADSRWQRTLKDHQLAINVGLQASLFVASTAFQDLEAQYLLERNDVQDEGLPGQGVDRSLEWGLVLGVADTYRATPSLDLKAQVEARRNRFEFDADRRDTSELLSAGVGFSKRWQRINWDTNAELFQLTFRDQVNPDQPSRKQDLASFDSQLSTPLASRLRLGVGYRSFTTTFTDSPSRSIHGPSLSLQRQADGRFAWDARFSVLRETNNSEREGQSFGSLNLSFRISPRSNFVMIVSKEVDLLRYYQSFTADRLLLDTEQQYTFLQSLQWELLSGRSRWSILYVKTEQKFAGLLVNNESLSSAWTWKASRVSDYVQSIIWRRGQEGQNFDAGGARQVIKTSHGYRHFWGGGSRLQGYRPYGSLTLEYEHLRDGAINRTFERLSLLLALGQEWQL